MSDPAPMEPPDVLTALGVSFRLHEHPGVVEPVEVCAALGVPLERTVKTLAFVTPEDRLLLAALPGHARLRYGPLARAAGVRRADLVPADARRLARAGMRPGGVCPVSTEAGVLVVFDAAVSGLGRVYCGSGRADRSVEIDAGALVAAAPAAVTAPIGDVPGAKPAVGSGVEPAVGSGVEPAVESSGRPGGAPAVECA
ncbi:aminoacyl-tRNA deacylase [Streptomyces puniciscabiei]